MIELRAFVTDAGDTPFEVWFAALNAQAASKVTVALVRLERGNTSNVKGVGEGVFEQKIDWGPGYRIYFGRDGDALVILLAGGTKQRQQRDIAAAKVLWTEYKSRRRKL